MPTFITCVALGNEGFQCLAHSLKVFDLCLDFGQLGLGLLAHVIAMTIA